MSNSAFAISDQFAFRQFWIFIQTNTRAYFFAVNFVIDSKRVRLSNLGMSFQKLFDVLEKKKKNSFFQFFFFLQFKFG